MDPLSIKIDVTKIDKEALYKGAKGTYLTLTVWPNKEGRNQYGDDAIVKQDLGKDRRDEKPEIIGNARIIERRNAPQSKPQEPPARAKTIYEEMNDADEIPF
jgi:hypothetical protein